MHKEQGIRAIFFDTPVKSSPLVLHTFNWAGGFHGSVFAKARLGASLCELRPHKSTPQDDPTSWHGFTFSRLAAKKNIFLTRIRLRQGQAATSFNGLHSFFASHGGRWELCKLIIPTVHNLVLIQKPRIAALWTPIRLIPRNLATSAAECPTSSTANQAGIWLLNIAFAGS